MAENNTFDRIRGQVAGRDRPLHFVANPNSRSYGDFTGQLWAINTIIDQFDRRTLTLLFKDDMDFKRGLLRLMLPIDRLVVLPAKQLMPSMDILNAEASDPGAGVLDKVDDSTREWFASGQNRADMFIADQMAAARWFCNLDRVTHLRFPEEDARACTETLASLGVKPDRWFATVHCREPGYESKPERANLRDQDPRTFIPAVAHIIHNLGGQVVRLGHPAMSEFPAMKGLVDLSRARGNAFLQTFAISRSRFLVCGPSGPVAVANALNTPVAQVNSFDVLPDNDRMVYRTIKVVMDGGRKLAQAALYEAGFSKKVILEKIARGDDIRVFLATAEDVVRISDYIFDRTADTTGWRAPPPRDQRPRPNKLIWPGNTRMRGTFLPEDYVSPARAR